MILVSLILTIGFHEALTYPKFTGGENANLGQFPYQVIKNLSVKIGKLQVLITVIFCIEIRWHGMILISNT